jgi:OFA family oxalate/formate antiporter-like MFS transporter
MALIANQQYSWTLFVEPIHAAQGWTLTNIQWAFSIFIATETWLTPVAGIVVDRFGPRTGPRATALVGGVLVGIGWVANAYADSLVMLYVGSAVSGAGAGAIYATCVGNAVRWFPDHRGLAVGLTAAGFGGGAALTVIPVRHTIEVAGYANTFLWFGIGQAILLGAIACVLRGPDGPILIRARAAVSPQRVGASVTSAQMLCSPIFWLLYIMFVGVSASGLMVSAQLAPIALDYGISSTVLFGGATTLSVALVIDNVLNGVARPFFGYLSDRIGRENTMAIAFTLGALSYWLLAIAGHSPWAFVVCSGLIFFTWGEIFSLFPSTCTDIFGTKHATANASLLYTAKGTSAFLVPAANLLKSASGTWESVFIVAALINVLVVLLALFVLRRLRTQQQRRTRPTATSQS